MATEHVKVYEEKKSLPIWAWLLPLLLLALLAWLFFMHRAQPVATGIPITSPAATANNNAAPNLGAIHFETDKAELTPEGTATLTRAAEYMKQNPGAHLRIEGFTDATGTEPHNDDLSTRRALAAGHFLEGQGIDRSRLTGGGFGAGNPANTNATDAGKADNRRVELFSQQ